MVLVVLAGCVGYVRGWIFTGSDVMSVRNVGEPASVSQVCLWNEN